MINLTIDNSYSRIEGLNAKQEKELKNLLSYMPDPGASFYSGGHNRGPRYLIDKRGAFPTGLLYLVDQYLAEIKHSRNDIRRVPLARNEQLKANLPYPPYEEQIVASAFAQASDRGVIVAPTGLGKSAIIALIIDRLKVSTLIVVPSLELKSQLIASLSTAFGAENVGGILLKRFIAVENVGSTALAKGDMYDCVIIDEFHHAGAKTYRDLNKKTWTKTYYRFGLTATPFRSQDHERLLLESVLSETIYEISYNFSVGKGYIVPMEAFYVEVPRQEINAYTWREVYSKLVVNNKARNSIISAILSATSDFSTLCLVKEIAHGEAIKECKPTHFANGQDDDSALLIQAFNTGKIKSLIGTTGVIGEGVDTKPAEYIIIAGLGKSKNAFMQQVGRGFRKYKEKESCKIIIFKDDSHKSTKAHFKAQVKYLKEEYGVVPTLLKVL